MAHNIAQKTRILLYSTSNGRAARSRNSAIIHAMFHLKGLRFDFPLVKRLGVIEDRSTHRIDWNVHAGCEVHYVFKGGLTWEFNGHPKPISVPGGAFLVMPPRMRHRAAGETGTPSERLGIIYEPVSSDTSRGTTFAISDLRRIFKRFNSAACSVRPTPPRLGRLLKELREAIETFDIKSDDTRLYLKILNEHLLYETYRALSESEVLPRDGNVIPQIRNWISLHLAEDFTTEDLVRRSGYGRSRFFDLFLAETGMTPGDYVVRARVDRACRLLADKSEDKILDIALKCGFKSAVNFSIAFRRHVGKSPSEFRSS